MLVIILIECLMASYLLVKVCHSRNIYLAVTVSNLISGILGIIGSFLLNGGWWIVVWFPWVSKREVRGPEGFKALVIFYAIVFVLTLIIEGLVNYFMLKKSFPKSKILGMTLGVNLASYALGSLAMYSYSF